MRQAVCPGIDRAHVLQPLDRHRSRSGPGSRSPHPRIHDGLKAHDSGLAVWWAGHNGWLIKSDGLLIGIDLATEDEARLYRSPITAEELAPLLDIAFITHKHGDHFNRNTVCGPGREGPLHLRLAGHLRRGRPPTRHSGGRIIVATPRKPFELKGVMVSPASRYPREPEVRHLLRREPGRLRLPDRARRQDVPPAGRLGPAGGPPLPQARRRAVLLAHRAQHARRPLCPPDQRARARLYPPPAPRHVPRHSREPLLDERLPL